jgi:hypothetical protein
VAVTVNVWGVRSVRLLTVTDVAVPAAVAVPPGLPVTVYAMIGLPPLLAGAVHDTRADPLPAVAEAVPMVGAPGTVVTLVVAGAVLLPGVRSSVAEPAVTVAVTACAGMV